MPTLEMTDKFDKYKDMDLDELLATLTEEQLQELMHEMDPDNSLLPPSERMKNQTTKTATGPFDRQALMDFLENQAKQEKDWDEKVPFKAGEKRGKVFTKKEEEKPKIQQNGKEEKLNVGEEWENALESATEQDLVELAGILGLHSMLDQEQYQAALRDDDLGSDRMKFTGVAKFTSPKLPAQEPPNDTDVEDALEKIKKNDKSLTDLNLNNIKNMSIETVKNILDAAGSNSNLKNLSMAGTRIGDDVAKNIAELMKQNKTLESFNAESNFITGEGIKLIMNAVKENTTLKEIRLANQRNMMGNQVETEVANILDQHNKTLIKFGFSFEHAGPRRKAHQAILRNLELVRKKRTNKE